MSKTSPTVPLSDLNGYSDGHLRWNIELPEYVPQEHILINTVRLGRMARLAGAKHLHVSSGGGEISQYNTSVMGFDNQGNAIAGTSSTIQRADLQDVESSTTGELRTPSQYKWADSRIKFNTSEMSDRIVHDEKYDGSTRNPKEWAHYLDKGLRAGLRTAAYQNLVSNLSLIDKLEVPALIGIYYLLLESGIFGTPSGSVLSNVIGATLLSQPILGVEERVIHGRRLKERRWSVLPGMQFDRLAVVHGLTRARKIIKST